MPNEPSGPSDPHEIRERSLSAVRWTAAKTVVVALLGPVSQIVKARFLIPAELGAVAVLMIVYGFVHTLENAGLGQSIVQKQELNLSDRFTYLALSAVLGVAGSVFLVAASGALEAFFGVPGSRLLLVIAGPLLLLAVVEQYMRALLHRDLLFRDTELVESGKRVLNVVLLLVFLIAGWGPVGVVLALLLANLLGAAALSILALHHGVVRLEVRWSKSAADHLWKFGLPVAAKQLFTHFTHRADELIVAVALSAETLGFYHLAKETLQRLQSLITGSFARVLLSMFSRIRSDTERLTRAYQRITLMVSYIGISVFVGIALTAHNLVPALFGSRWLEAVPVFRVLAVALVPIVVTANLSSSLLFALGRARSVLAADVAVNLPYLLLLYGLHRYGLMAILFCYLGYCFVKAAVLQAMSNRRLHMSSVQHVSIYVRAIARVLVMAVAVLSVGLVPLSGLSHLLQAGITIMIGVGTMTAVTYFTDRDVFRQVKLILAAG